MLKVEIINYGVQGISDSITATWKFVEKFDNCSRHLNVEALQNKRSIKCKKVFLPVSFPSCLPITYFSS
jgi:hypothetical protein